MNKLIERAKRGDSESFIEAITLCNSELYKIGKAMSLNDEDIGDLIQETILTAYKKINTLKKVDFFKTWLIRIFINKSNSLKKKNGKVIFMEDINAINLKEDFKGDNLHLRESINKLKKDSKEVIILFYIMGYSIKEISTILQLKEGSIKSRLSRARNDLRILYGVHEGVR